MLTLLLADAELERVPARITGHLQVQQAARRAGVNASRMLLDSSLHHAAMRGLEDGERRGRPDLVHFFLLTALDSRLNAAGKLQVLVHTREGRLIRIRPETRLQRNYNRFCGLIQQLFDTGKVPPENPLLTMEEGWTVKDVGAKLAPQRLLVMDEAGTPTQPWQLFGPVDVDRHVMAIVGGFPSGRFRSELPPGDRISFGPDQLTVWTVASELVTNYARFAVDG